MRGRFITFEGGEGAGKSTQVARLAERLRELGHETATTREPGGSSGAELLRDILVKGQVDRWSPTSEALLMYAGRRDHLERVIRPALERGAWVVCDRFADSTRAYQGAGGGVDPGFIADLDRWVVGADQPDLTLIFDLPVEVGLERAFGRDMFEARFEAKGLPFHQRLRDAFRDIAAREPERCTLIDAVGERDDIAARVWRAVEERLAP